MQPDRVGAATEVGDSGAARSVFNRLPDSVTGAATTVLEQFLALDGPGEFDADPGVSLLAGALWKGGHIDESFATAVIGTWLNRLPTQVGSRGLFGGIAGVYVGVQAARAVVPGVSALGEILRVELLQPRPPAPVVGWESYDLISGPSGVILALLDGDEASDVVSLAELLASRTSVDGLDGFRIDAYADDELRSWNQGRVNTGLAHGIPGVMTALAAMVETDCARPSTRAALRTLGDVVAAEVFQDERGIDTWTPHLREGAAPPSGASSRQAWCYGTPGVAWALLRAGASLPHEPYKEVATTAMRTFCDAFDSEYHVDAAPLDCHLAICHGMAGTMLVADSFARKAALPEATALRAHLRDRLIARLDDVVELTHDNPTVLTGASGVVLALLTAYGGGRTWMCHLGLL